MSKNNKNSQNNKNTGNVKKEIEQIVRFLVSDIVANLGFKLWDVEFYSEAGESFLEITIDRIDKSSGGVSLDDCEAVTYAINPVIDAADPIENRYSLLVSSPGLNRELKNDSHINYYIGKIVSVKLFAKNEVLTRANIANTTNTNSDGKNFTGVIKENAGDTMTFELCAVRAQSAAKNGGKNKQNRQNKQNKQKGGENNIIDSEHTEQKPPEDTAEANNNIITLARKDIAHIYAYDEIDI